MILSGLTIRDFAGVQTVELTGLHPGLNVIVGDNEAGKSTLLMALRAALFQKHRAGGEAARNLSPYNRQVRPEIALDFSIGDTAYALRKAFIQRPDAQLEWSGGKLSGDAVEEKLAELFRFSHPGRGESKLDANQGAFGLLWVEQGRSVGGIDLGAGKDAVTASLEGEIGQILGGERGRLLLTAAKVRQDQFFTETGRPKTGSALKIIEEELAALAGELQRREAEQRDYEDKLDRLRNLRHTLSGYQADAALQRAEDEDDAARRSAADIEALLRDRDGAARDLAHAEARRQHAGERLRDRELSQASRAEAEDKAAKAADKLATCRDDFAAADTRYETARQAADVARQTLDNAERRLASVERREEAEELVRRRSLAGERLTAVEAIEAKLAELRGQPAVVDDSVVAAIEAAERESQEAAIRRSAAAALVRFEPASGQAVGTRTGQVGSDIPVKVESETIFDLQGFGRIVVTPGGQAGDLARIAEDAERRLATLLARHGLASVDHARRERRAAEERRLAERALQAELKALAPQGSASLREEAAVLDRRLAEANAADDRSLAGTLPTRAEARQALADARDAAKAAEATLAVSRAERDARSASLVRAEADAEHAAAHLKRLAADIANAEAALPLETLRNELAAAELDRSAKAAVSEQKRAAFEAADPEAIRLELKRASGALEVLRRTLADLERQSVSLEAEIRTLGLNGLGEDIARLEGEIDVARRRRDKLALEADASRLLYGTLIEAQRDARDSWLGPIKTQVGPYLRLIHPGSEVELDEETLEIKSLHRRGVQERFERLSAGAREQVAVVTRLALAQVLKKGGHPAAVILDDALVNTDEKRLSQMHLVLQKAAEDLQIIVLTCRERDFHRLGAPIFRL
ncbi:AAA family ATPase [Mangrovicella endophytica]|uniref:AAA family ATPase n=1 Tax=Mangrovicella endophytica TaxID=2066697 RepID=UPI000C9DC066|nr:ATP-binding protein [Mangrovicella endophytica]